jgi:hypothetical protein
LLISYLRRRCVVKNILKMLIYFNKICFLACFYLASASSNTLSAACWVSMEKH